MPMYNKIDCIINGFVTGICALFLYLFNDNYSIDGSCSTFTSPDHVTCTCVMSIPCLFTCLFDDVLTTCNDIMCGRHYIVYIHIGIVSVALLSYSGSISLRDISRS
eukprot:114243_1